MIMHQGSLQCLLFHAKNKSKQNHIEYRLAKAQATCGQLEQMNSVRDVCVFIRTIFPHNRSCL